MKEKPRESGAFSLGARVAGGGDGSNKVPFAWVSQREIRVLSNNIAGAHRERDQLLAALALSQSLSRADMARAAGLSKPRIDQILYEVATENAR